MNAEFGPFNAVFPEGHTHHHFMNGVYAKELHIPRGFVLVSHRHRYDHLSILASGEIWLTVDGATRTINGPRAITIRAGTEHTVRAITDAVWFCVHPTDETDIEKIDETLIEKDAV